TSQAPRSSSDLGRWSDMAVIDGSRARHRALSPRSRFAVTPPRYGCRMTDAAPQERSLFVSWRDPIGSIHPIGLLVRRSGPEGERYSFAYLKMAEKLPELEPLPGLPDLHRRYDNEHLFPVFANRVMPRSRPDYDLLASRVDLSGD